MKKVTLLLALLFGGLTFESCDDFKLPFGNSSSEKTSTEKTTDAEDDADAEDTADVHKKHTSKNKSKKDRKLKENISKRDSERQSDTHAAEPSHGSASNSNSGGSSYATSRVIVAGDNVCLRSQPDEAYKMTGPNNPHLYTGEIYDCVGESGNYYCIIYNGGYYYLPKQYGRPRLQQGQFVCEPL